MNPSKERTIFLSMFNLLNTIKVVFCVIGNDIIEFNVDRIKKKVYLHKRTQSFKKHLTIN